MKDIHPAISDDLPENATRVYKGTIFEVWSWPQEMFDGSIETFERVRRPHTADIIAVVGEKSSYNAKSNLRAVAPFTPLLVGA
jgi:hypothetical protein